MNVEQEHEYRQKSGIYDEWDQLYDWFIHTMSVAVETNDVTTQKFGPNGLGFRHPVAWRLAVNDLLYCENPVDLSPHA